MTTPLATLSACSQRPYPRKYSILYSSTSPPQMAYIYLLSFPHRWRYRPFPFSLPLHSLTYITRQQTSMAASSVATRPGNARSATLFLGRGPPKNTYGGPFHTPAQKYIRRGRTLPYPNLWASADPYLGEAVEPWSHCPSPTLGKPLSYSPRPLWGSCGAMEPSPSLGKQWSHCPSPTLGKPWSHSPSPSLGKLWSHGAITLFGEAVEPLPIPNIGGSRGAIAHPQPWGSRCTDVVAGSGRSIGPKNSKMGN